MCTYSLRNVLEAVDTVVYKTDIPCVVSVKFVFLVEETYQKKTKQKKKLKYPVGWMLINARLHDQAGELGREWADGSGGLVLQV